MYKNEEHFNDFNKFVNFFSKQEVLSENKNLSIIFDKVNELYEELKGEQLLNSENIKSCFLECIFANVCDKEWFYSERYKNFDKELLIKTVLRNDLKKIDFLMEKLGITEDEAMTSIEKMNNEIFKKELYFTFFSSMYENGFLIIRELIENYKLDLDSIKEILNELSENGYKLKNFDSNNEYLNDVVFVLKKLFNTKKESELFVFEYFKKPESIKHIIEFIYSV
jgi:hypothetical protein